MIVVLMMHLAAPPAMPESPGELDLLRAYLRDRDVACPVCRHNLRGTAHFACPECGGRLDLHVTSMDMPHRWWVACLLAFALPLGLFGALSGAGTWSLAHGWMSAHDGGLLGACWGLTLLCAISLLMLVRRRTRFIQKPLLRQRAQGIVLWILLPGMSWVMIFLMTRSEYDWPWILLTRNPLP
jgi:hypothetical protein